MKKTDKNQNPKQASGYQHAAGKDWSKLEKLFETKESQAQKLANEYLKTLDL